MKQVNLFGEELAPEGNQYTSEITAPVYEPKNRKPHILELINKTQTHKLMREIERSTLPYDEKMFLLDAARRHNVFNYELIADYYAHSSPEMQRLMEKSALVIIDFNEAILRGYVNTHKEIKKQYLEEYSVNSDDANVDMG